MALDPVRVEETRGWLVKTASDLRGAEIDLAAVPPLLDDLVFHCQQAAEKALKAFLTWYDEPFRIYVKSEISVLRSIRLWLQRCSGQHL